MAAAVHLMKTPAELALAETFAAAADRLPGTPDIAAGRAAAFAQFSARGLPHRRVEAWRYTDLRTLMRDAAPLAAPPDAAAKARAGGKGALFAAVAARRLYVVNGAFVPGLSDLSPEPGLAILSMAAALAQGDPLVAGHLGQVVPSDDAVLALNTALMGDGVVIHVAKGTALARPIHIVHVADLAAPAALFVRSLLVAEEEASVSLIETHEGPADIAYQVNGALEIVAGDGARVSRVKVTAEGSAAQHLASLSARVGAEAAFSEAGFVLGGALVRNQLAIRLDGADTVAHVCGASLLSGRQHADTTLVMEHAAPRCESREAFRAVLDGAARDVFQGRIAVRQAAQKTDARMMSRALLLSDTAEANAKPELEIFADDVQCGHGCTAGALDANQKFYLMARGIPATEAEALLIEAFVGEVVDQIEDETVRDALMGAIRAFLLARR
ncbi:Fe-S cluster assembly protein SufD [Xanthobacter tagetidis]|uniref:Fe-S cluster assembly protein SufD n=1 Tax=Xanthobacter tagetidis TaxID=60216 RepID=A0A3L7AQI7_9HYPH|nr:Fe-S cluster assembly protein SufD [Xanthobacter tagetidis]MBB6308113.1 Fe-S cluster assembly protein SufD [Xanthobacter tagetidis]RLP81738.1 Fe-S cluster assembly protein SufD [Xanthobacter tagetidis]